MDLNQNFTRKIGKKMNLIDMNKDIINFKCNFSVISDKTFKAVVITQEQLDNSDFKIEYQDVKNGTLNGSFENVNNVYYNYCLLLKADEEITVNVKINILPLPKTEPEPQPQSEPQQEHRTYEHFKTNDEPFYKSSTFIWIIIFIGIGLIIYLLFSDDKHNQISNPAFQTDKSYTKSPLLQTEKSYTKSPLLQMDNSSTKSPLLQQSFPTVSPSISVSQPIKSSPQSLLSKLKNMDI
jgi:ATP-dependent Zn protease